MTRRLSTAAVGGGFARGAAFAVASESCIIA